MKQQIFNQDHFNSGDGMLTSVWGPSLWHYLHVMSFNYPINPTKYDKKHYKNFIINLKYVLPCKYCRINFVNNLKHNPLKICHLKNRYTFSRYVYDLHELINSMLGKKSNLTYDQVRERYEHFRARCGKKNKLKKTKKKKRKKICKTRKESGCVEPYYGIKSKCILNIVPNEKKVDTININKKCITKIK